MMIKAYMAKSYKKFMQVKGFTMSLYWQSMQLAYDPFMAEQANQTPFISPKWEQQLNLLVHLATGQDAMLLVLGVSGIGKSTMMRQFIESLGHVGGICKIHGGATITTDVLQDLVARHLGFALATQDPEAFSNKLLEQIGRMRAEGHDFYLVIDNAHKLPKASLSLLLEMIEHQGADHHPIHIILFGGPQLEATIGDITTQHLGEVLTHSIHIEPLTLDYVAHYVEQRLKRAGFSDALPFTQGQLQQIYQISGGIPSKVNSLARQLLLQWNQQSGKKGQDRRIGVFSGKKKNKQDTKPMSIYWYAGAAVAVVAAVMIVMIYFNAPATHVPANQAWITSANKANGQQDYDKAGSENAAPSVDATQQNAIAAPATTDVDDTAVASQANDDDTDTAVASQAGADAAVTSNQANDAGAAQSQADTASDTVYSDNAQGNADVADGNASVNSTNYATDTAAQSVGSATTSDGGSAMVDSSTSQAVDQALAANAAIAKPAPVSPKTSAKAIALPEEPAGIVPTASSTSALVSTTTSPKVATQSALGTDDAEYIPAGASQIPSTPAAMMTTSSASATKPTTVAKVAPKHSSNVTTHQSAAVKPVAKPVAATKPAAGAKSIAATKPVTTAKAETTAKSVVAAKPVVLPKTTQSGLTDTHYFSAQPGQHMALQLAGSRDFAALQRQVVAYNLPQQVRYFKTALNGQPWYVAVYGNYPSLASAVNAKASLPLAVQTTKPWPRSYQSIQSAMQTG